jgi:hypothetical protein
MIDNDNDEDDVFIGSYKGDQQNIDNLMGEIANDLQQQSSTITMSSSTTKTQMEDEIDDITNKLLEKYNISPDTDVVSSNSDKSQQTQKLINAKIIKSISEKSKLKRLLSLSALTEAMTESLMTNIKGLKQMDPDIINSIGLVFQWNSQLDRMMKEYTKMTGIEESLSNINISDEKQREQDEINNMSQADRQAIIAKLLETNDKEDK